ncbi:MAG: carotenoid biosynthesis protein [Bryobacteraceae bacterium]
MRETHAAWAGITVWLWALVVLYGFARVTQAFPDNIPILVIVGLHVFTPLVFALVHGALGYGRRRILVFIALCLVIGNIFENLSIATGFPFGHYQFTSVMGPKLFQVPILLGLAYIGMGYVSWTLGIVLVGDLKRPLAGHRVVTVPLVAAFAMVGWDLSMDPIWSNLVHSWVWRNGGAYFGVPVSNFFGWYL